MQKTQASGHSVVGTPAPAGSVSVGSSHGDLTQSRSYNSRASHGDDASSAARGNDAAAAGSRSTRTMFDWDALDVDEEDFAMRFPGGAAGPAPPPSEAGARFGVPYKATPKVPPQTLKMEPRLDAQPDANMGAQPDAVDPVAKAELWTWLSNNFPPAPQHALGKGKGKGKRSYMIDSGSPAMNTPMAPVPKPSTATSAWRSSRSAESWNSNWSNRDTHGVPPWNADHEWQRSGRGWQAASWRDDAWQGNAADGPAAKRGSAPYGEPKGKRGKKGDS